MLGEEVVIETTNNHPGHSPDITATTEMPPPSVFTDVDYVSPRQAAQIITTVDDAMELSQDISAVDEFSKVAPVLMDSNVTNKEGTSTCRQRSGKSATRKRFPLQNPRWEKTKLTIRYLYHENIS